MDICLALGCRNLLNFGKDFLAATVDSDCWAKAHSRQAKGQISPEYVIFSS